MSPNGQMFYTGTSGFLSANEHIVRAMLDASAHCTIHASEDIFDANGLKLWARGRAIDEHLLERLANRKLRKPIELCVYAADPVAVAGIVETIEQRLAASPDLAATVGPRLRQVLKTVGAIVPTPTELMLFSVMRHGGRDLFGHSAVVTALALAALDVAGAHADLRRPLAMAALMHDVGELYLPPSLFAAPGPVGAAQIREVRRHARIGAEVAVELARSGRMIAQLIAQSHERLDGWGYPSGATAAELPVPAQALLFAEAMAPLIEFGTDGLRRAAVAARLVPGEFPRTMVDWVVNAASSRPAVRLAYRTADAIALDLRQAHSVLARAQSLLASPSVARETTAVRVASARWLIAVQVLIDELSRAGVDSALKCDIEIEPQDDGEAIELGVLSQELLYRVREFANRVELACDESPALEASSLVIELAEILRACEPAPERTDAEGRNRIELLPWSDLYCIGVRQIDDQHKVLVDLLNRVARAASGGGDSAIVEETLAALMQYVETHFGFEEELMRRHGYASMQSHIEAHGRLVGRLQALVARNGQGQSLTTDELMAFLRQWLIAHILHTDKALGMALNEMGVH